MPLLCLRRRADALLRATGNRNTRYTQNVGIGTCAMRIKTHFAYEKKAKNKFYAQIIIRVHDKFPMR